MITNYLKLASRNLSKRKGYSLLNIGGLAIGMSCTLLILQYVSYERSYDKFEPSSKQIVRLRLDSYQQGKLAWQSATSYPGIGPALKRDYPEVEDFCRLIDNNVVLANTKTNVKFKETKGYYADPSAIKMLGINLVKGDPKQALTNTNDIIISESMAKKYFGDEEALGQRLQIRDANAPSDYGYEISGVFRDYPHNSHLIINYLVSYTTLDYELKRSGDTSNAAETSFNWYDFYTYLQMKPGVNIKNFESKFPAFCDRYINSREWNKTNNVKSALSIIPLSNIYLYSNYNQEAEVNGNGKSVSFLFLIGFIILAIAWINYINLATARSVERGREVGVRKLLGAGRMHVIRQFMLESLLLNIAAVAIALMVAYLLSPLFNSLMGRADAASFSLNLRYSILFASILVFGTLLSGLYPAFVMSGYKPVVVLKGAFKNTSRGLLLRKGLIVLQFAISVVLIAGTMIVFRQVSFMRRQKIGVNINQTLVLDGAQTLKDSVYQNSFQPFKNEILKLPGIKSVAASTTVPGEEIYWTSAIQRLNPPGSPDVTLYHLGIDYDFIPQFGIKLIAGRNFSKDFPTDEKSAILNEQAVSLLGFKNPEEAINQKIIRRDTLTVIGVVQGFHHLGLQKAIDPQLILLRKNARNRYSIKLSSNDMAKSVAAVQRIWNMNFPNDPFDYFFLDEFYNAQYKSDQQFGKVFGLFACLAIIIACFGLLGLSAYNVLQRTKEIGIRKVLGASVQNVLFILSKDFMLLVVIAFIIAVPVTWWVMYNWLQDFAYRISIQLWVFGVAGLLAILIALLTISFQAVKAAIANPVTSLRNE